MSALEESLRAVFKLPPKGSKTIPELGVPFEPRPIEPMNPLRPFDRFRQPKIETRTPTMFDGSPIPEGMVINPRMTLEYRDANQNGIEDRSEGLYLPRDLIPMTSEIGEFELDGKMLRPSVPAPADFNLFRPAITDMEQDDPEEQKTLRGLLEQAEARNQAPLGEMANILQSAGTGEDTILAHLTPGEVILDPRFFEDPKFEAEVERKFRETGLDPEAYTAGSGIANLNIETGVPEYGFFKKIGKKLKKVVKKVAPIASFIPGVGTALGGVLGGIGGFATKIPGIGGALGKIGSTVAGGIANLGIPGISSIARGTAGGYGGIGKALTTKAGLLGGGMFGETGSMYAGGPEAGKGLANMIGMGSGTAGQVEAYQQAQAAQATLDAMTPEAMAAMDPKQLQQLQNIAAGGASTGFMSNVGSLFGGGQQQQLYDAQGNLVQSRGGGGFGDFAKLAGIGALSAGLGKLAYEDAQKQKGVALTPLTTMSPTGRYNIEAEIARRMGQARPNPVEFGLLPEGTIPQLSGGQPRMAALGGGIENLTGGMARGLQEGGAANPINPGGSAEEAAMNFIIRAEGDPRLKNTPEYEMANRMSGFAMRMKMADDKIDAMVPTRRETGAVVNERELPPGGIGDTMIQALLPESIEDMFRSERVLDFENAAQNFATALLRAETGAVISDDELDFIMRTYMPQPGDSQSTILEKSNARKIAIQSLMPKQKPQSKGIGSMMPMMNGGPIMAYAQGGAVAMQEGGEMNPKSFPRMDGDINGPGTEQSDDIPAMLSDGEFVMTARAVRGAGSYEMQTEPGGIINLVPSLEEDRERGMDVMYKVMDTFSGQANPS